MRIAVAQLEAVKGDIQRNIEHHKKLINLAVSHEADILVFPELSLTGYEPELAEALSTTKDDPRFEDFQVISNTHQLTIGVGVPLNMPAGICISMVLFQPSQPRQVYHKRYIHEDEEPYFTGGQLSPVVIGNPVKIGLAICYELSVPAHAEKAAQHGAEVYLASVAKAVEGVDAAGERLAEIARKYGMIVCMSNCIGKADNFDCGGKSAIWNRKGQLVGQMNDREEGILLIDTERQTLIQSTLNKQD